MQEGSQEVMWVSSRLGYTCHVEKGDTNFTLARHKGIYPEKQVPSGAVCRPQRAPLYQFNNKLAIINGCTVHLLKTKQIKFIMNNKLSCCLTIKKMQ